MRSSGTGIRLLAVLAVGAMPVLLAQATPAAAGQARAQFNAAIHIDPALVRQDLERLARDATQLAARNATATVAARPRVLPLAGGGVCVRRQVSTKRFRWICR